jgi:hypothetical protein
MEEELLTPEDSGERLSLVDGGVKTVDTGGCDAEGYVGYL